MKKGTDLSVIYSGKRQFEIDLNFLHAKGSAKMILGNSEENVVLEVNSDEGFISFDRTKTANPGAISFRKAKLRTDGELENLKVICDTCSLELFVNDGIMAFTNTFFFESKFSDFIVINIFSKDLTYDFCKIEKNMEID